jgi:ATP-dependent helicase HrpB
MKPGMQRRNTVPDISVHLWQNTSMSESIPAMPVERVLPEISQKLSQARCAILQAPTGSGKTTRVPLALLDTKPFADQRILMLEPRRLAATNAARYMSSLLEEPVGGVVGYSIRYESKTSKNTRLEVITEGLLTRRMQNDPELNGVGLVIFDEFHERSLQADLVLALCRDIQNGLRDDLHILIMSATLEVKPLSRLLGNCPIIVAEGRSFPVQTDYLGGRDRAKIVESTAHGIRHAIKNNSGDILAFLPGSGEIKRCCRLLNDLNTEVALRPLYGGLPFADQESAILPGEDRRVVLATNVAETSLTIEGIEVVVDSGWEKRARYDAARGMTRLELVRISQASADQRTGRAGRLGPGRCYRMWSEGEHGALLPFTPPEIRQADLVPFVFELAQWGVQEASALSLLDNPPEASLRAPADLLAKLGAIDANGILTALGREMARYPTHPRLARLLVAAVAEGCPTLGSELVALLSERDIIKNRRGRSQSKSPSDLLERIDVLRNENVVHAGVVRRAAQYWKKATRAGDLSPADPDTISRLLALAYPDRIGLRRNTGDRSYLLSNGQGVSLAATSSVQDAEWLVAVELFDRGGSQTEISLASALSYEAIEDLFGAKIRWQRESGWDEKSSRIVTRHIRRLGAITLQEKSVPTTPEDSLDALLALIRQRGLSSLSWTRECQQLQARVNFLHSHLPEDDWPDWSNSTLLENLEEWLAAYLDGINSLKGLKKVDLATALKGHLGWQKTKRLDQLAPQVIEVPSGSKIKLDYTAGETPVLAVKLQEMFGLATSPALAGGRVPIRIHLLSPAGRPLAVTSDLKSFWDSVYPEVQKEMKGRYPKHPWPDDPWQEQATRRTKRFYNSTKS